VNVSPGLVEVDALGIAIDDLVDHPAPLLPSSPLAFALRTNRDEIAHWALGQTNGSFSPAREEIIAVSKGSHGIRPVAILDVPSTLLYSALVQTLAPSLPSQERGTYSQFLRAPLESGSTYVVTADIASCYSLIDHVLLSNELMIQSGDYATVNALTELLRESSGKAYGLPQQSPVSDVLAEAFLDRLERAITRRGLKAWRYNDDFRVACDTWAEVVRSIEILSDESRELGLILNDGKTRTWKSTKYRDHLDEVEALRSSIADEVSLSLVEIDIDDYDGTVTMTGAQQVEIDTFTLVRLLEKWHAIAGDGIVDDSDKAEHRALLQLIPQAMGAFRADDPELPRILIELLSILRFEQTLTPSICRFLMTVPNEGALLDAFDRLLSSNPYLSGWQVWWLQQPVARTSGFAHGNGSTQRIQWARRAFTEVEFSPILQAHATLTLARHGLIEANRVLQLYDRTSPVVSPVIVLAMALLRPSAELQRAVTGDNRLHHWVFESAPEFA
jgi:RNA-directed DNA polymerase